LEATIINVGNENIKKKFFLGVNKITPCDVILQYVYFRVYSLYLILGTLLVKGDKIKLTSSRKVV
jgi:hypothetical protein